MNNTPEQSAIIEATSSTRNNLLVRSGPGTGKTSTLVLVAGAEPNVDTLCLAFNKRIEQEMTKRLPANCTARTINGLCHRAWGDTIGRRLTVDTSKNYKILKAEVEGLPSDKRNEAFKDFSDTLDMIGKAKSGGYIPDGHFPEAKRLLDDEKFFDGLDTIPTPLQEGLIKRVMVRSLKAAFEGTVDFDDQVLMAGCFSTVFLMFPRVLVDETQDLSLLNHIIMKKVARKRLIGVGDEFQSIYAFRGAHQNSMNRMRDMFDMTNMKLTVSFRCPQNVVKEAWWRTPDLKWPDWAVEGRVGRLDEWGVEDVPDHAAILCRNNAPLFGMAIKFLRAGRNIKLIGNDIGKGLLKIMKKFGQAYMAQAQVFAAIDAWVAEQEKKSRVPNSVYDRADCMRLFAEQGSDLGQAMAYAEHLFAQDGPVQLSTVHKAKGLEYDDVFLLDRFLIKTEADDQEKNLLYVAQTRAKQSLTYVESGGFVS